VLGAGADKSEVPASCRCGRAYQVLFRLTQRVE
jgi:hypothetical protein